MCDNPLYVDLSDPCPSVLLTSNLDPLLTSSSPVWHELSMSNVLFLSCFSQKRS